MTKQPLYPSTKGRKAKAPVSSLRHVSIKNLHGKLGKLDFARLMGQAEGLWGAVGDMAEDIEKVRAETTDPITKIALTDLMQELRIVQSFAFDLTEYL